MRGGAPKSWQLRQRAHGCGERLAASKRRERQPKRPDAIRCVGACRMQCSSEARRNKHSPQPFFCMACSEKQGCELAWKNRFALHRSQRHGPGTNWAEWFGRSPARNGLERSGSQLGGRLGFARWAGRPKMVWEAPKWSARRFIPLTNRSGRLSGQPRGQSPSFTWLHACVCSRSRSSGRLRAARGGHERSARL